VSIHEAALWAAFRATRYVVRDAVRDVVTDAEAREIEIRVDMHNPRLDVLLERRGQRQWCFVTASNPDSIPLAEATNRLRNARLRSDIAAAGFEALEGEGCADAGDWPAEASFLVLGIEPAAAVRLGRAHGQIAVLIGEAGAPAQLIDCRAGADAVD